MKIYCTDCVILMCSIVYLKSNYEFLKLCCPTFYVFHNINYKIYNVRVATDLRTLILNATVLATRKQNRRHC